MNIDKKKLRAEINSIAVQRRAGPPATTPFSMELYRDGTPEAKAAAEQTWRVKAVWEKVNSARRATLLCSLMAHSRGRLHIAKEWVAVNDATGSQRLVDRDMAYQARLIEGVAQEFELTPEQVAEVKAKRAAFLAAHPEFKVATENLVAT